MRNLRNLIVKIIAAFSILCISNVSYSQINTNQVMNIGRNALYFEDYILSIQYFNQVIKVKPYLADPYYYRAIAKLSLEDYRGAEEDCNLAIERNPFIVDAYQIRGIARQTLRKNKEAISDYKKGLELLPEQKILLMNKAVAESDIKDFSNSEKTFEELTKIYPKFEKAYLGRAQMYLQKGDTLKAIDDIDKSISLSKNDATAFVMRADINIKHNKFDKALQDMDEAIKLEPRQSGYFINRAFLKYKQDDYFGAMADYDYAIGLESTNVIARFNRSLLLAEVKDNNKAIDDLSYVISRESDNVMALYNRAELYYQTRQYKKAIKDFDAVIAKVPDMSGLYYIRSECKRLSGDLSGGERDYNTSKKMFKSRRQKKGNDMSKTSEDDIKNNEESAEDVKNKFKTLLTINNDNPVKPAYENKSRGKIQDNNFDIDAEPLFALTYYAVDNELKSNSNYVKEVTDLNEMKILPMTLFLSTTEARLREYEINKHFNSITYYTSLITDNGTQSVSYFARAIEYMMVKNYSAAVADLDKAIELSGNKFTLAYFVRANAKYMQMQSTDMPDDSEPSASENMLKDKLNKHRLAEVIDDYNKVIELSPKMVYALYNIGCIYLKMQDNTSAVSAFSKAIDLKQDFGEAYYNRGLVYFRLGNKDHGITDLSRAGEYGITPSYSVLKKMTK